MTPQASTDRLNPATAADDIPEAGPDDGPIDRPGMDRG